MRFLQNRAIAAMLVIVLALTIVQFGGYNTPSVAHAASNSQQQNQHPNCYPCYSFYGSNTGWMQTATSDWYEQNDNWCGVASVRAIQRYDWIYWGNSGGNSTTPGWDNSQSAIFSRLQNSGQSIWGRGSGGDNLASNISGDFGTDPHSLAYGAWYETPVSTDSQPYYFHNWIYKTSALTATEDISTDFGANTVSHNDPISATVDGGYHSFVVSGFYASGDPSQGSVSLESIATWDPWLNSSNVARDRIKHYNQTQEEIWSISDWTSVSFLWGQGYTTNGGQDPEPDTPNPYYNPPFPGGYTHHWVTYYVTIEQDRIPEDYTPVDDAIGEDGHLAPHNG